MADQSVERPNSQSETANLPPSSPWANEGQTIAAWVLVIIVVVGGTLSGVGVLVAAVWLFWVGMAVVVLGVVTGKLLQMAGYGQGGANTLARQARAHAQRRPQ
ncbi:HGxxPAAW family protein [Pengzhenrongella sp.]|jgi:uncharacterized membrane protein|uniref:HGxxPAAW family protein n=1 Tax=Pengzhenrongella sp. TaxID=2888820 RepID=UPI002F939018